MAAADIHHTSIFTNAGEDLRTHLLRRSLTEVTQVSLRGLVRAVLGPHHRIHRQLSIRGASTQDFLDTGILVVFQTQGSIGLLQVRRSNRIRHGVIQATTHAIVGHFSSSFTTETNSSKPSSEGPVSSSHACSGCGIKPTTRPLAEHTPAIALTEPLKLSV